MSTLKGEEAYQKAKKEKPVPGGDGCLTATTFNLLPKLIGIFAE